MVSTKKSTQVTYESNDCTSTVKNPHFIVSERGNAFFLACSQSTSAYNGLSFFDESSFTAIKYIHQLTPQVTPNKLHISSEHSSRSSKEFTESFFFSNQLACYHTSGSSKVALDCDIRVLDDYSIHGREHQATITEKDTCVVVEFSNSRGAFCLVTTADVSLCKEWIETPTAYDESRGGSSSWWVERRAELHCSDDTRSVFCPSSRVQEAIRVLQSDVVWIHNKSVAGLPSTVHAWRSLRGLITRTPDNEVGILAGHPWFFQVWARDEAIAVGGLFVRDEYELAGRILLRSISSLLDSGLVANRFPHSDCGSADGVGWVCARLRELFFSSRATLSSEQWRFVYDQVSSSLDRLSSSRFGDDGLVYNDSQETWMDTTGGTDDSRAGACVEIQALTLNMVRFRAELEEFFDLDSSASREWEQSMKSVVREEFFDASRGVLADRKGDQLIRPNVFIACYVYQELLTDTEWPQVFDTCIEKLYLDWGAFSSIDVNSDLFVSSHAGEGDRSYHRGDAWYFINNLAAVCLLRIDSERFFDVADAVFSSSRDELLWSGACGSPAEISSAKAQESFGCWSQAWSASTFLELAALLIPLR